MTNISEVGKDYMKLSELVNLVMEKTDLNIVMLNVNGVHIHLRL